MLIILKEAVCKLVSYTKDIVYKICRGAGGLFNDCNKQPVHNAVLRQLSAQPDLKNGSYRRM